MTPEPYYEDNHVTLYNGDCREILPHIAPVDLVLTDPPYNEVNSRDAEGMRRFDKGAADAADVNVEELALALDIACNGSIYVFCGFEQASPLLRAFKSHGRTTRMGVWEKSNPSPMHGDKFWISSVEMCVFAHGKNAAWNLHCASPVWRGPTERTYGGLHTTPKPEWLMKQLVQASSNEGDTVLDPFAGSGSTLRAAKDLGRRAIGIEIDRDYCDVIVKRLAQETLFGVPA